MIGRLNHVAIAVHDLEAASRVYRDMLGAELSAPLPQPEHGVTVVFITLPNTKVELLEPLGEGSPIAGFLARNPEGGIHHICYEVDDIGAARDRLVAEGARVLGPPGPKIGAHESRSSSCTRRIFAARWSSSSRPETGDDRPYRGFARRYRCRRHPVVGARDSSLRPVLRPDACRRALALFRDLVDGPFRGPALRHSQPARGRAGGARRRPRRTLAAAP